MTAELFYKGGEPRLAALRRLYPLVVRTARLSLGTPGPLDRLELEWFARLVEVAHPLWITEHLGFRRTEEVDLGFPVPLRLDQEALTFFAEHCQEVMERCRTRVLVQAIASPLGIQGTMSQPEFLNRLCEAAGCGIAIDAGSLLADGRNGIVDPARWLDEIEARHVVQLIVGGVRRQDAVWSDAHDDRVEEAVWSLAREVVARAPVRAALLQRDASFPTAAELEAELATLVAIAREAGGAAGAGSGERPDR